MKKGIADVQSMGLLSPVGSQNIRQKDVINKDVISKILEGDPVGAANRVKICIRNNTSKRKRIQEEAQEQDTKADLKKPCVKPFYSSTPCPPQKRSSVDSDCCLGSTGSFEESEADAAPQHCEFINHSQWECAEGDYDLDDSLLEPSDNEQVDSPFRLTEDEITSLLDDNLEATDPQKCAVEVSSCEISYWHARNQAPEISESKLSLVKNTVTVSRSESPGEWAERLFELSERYAKEERVSACKKESQLGDVECGQVVNMPFDFDIDELLALSPIDGSAMYSAGDYLEVDEEPFLSESKPLKEGHDRVTEYSQCEIIVSSKPNLKRQDPIPVLVEKDLSPKRKKVVKEISLKSEICVPTKTSAPSQKRIKAPLVASCIVVPQTSSGKGTNSQKLNSFLLQLNKSLDVQVSSPVVSSSSESTPSSSESTASSSESTPSSSKSTPSGENTPSDENTPSGKNTPSSSNSSCAQGSESLGPRNVVLSELTKKSASNAKSDKEKNVVSSKDSATVLPSVKKLVKVVPITKVENRPRMISPAELEWKKQAYMQSVLRHIRSSEDPNQGAYDELLTLMDQVASVEYRNPEQNWQHPSDLTTRNYPRFAKKPPNKYSINQWINRNGGSHRRFHNVADHFQRSSVIAFSSL